MIIWKVPIPRNLARGHCFPDEYMGWSLRLGPVRLSKGPDGTLMTLTLSVAVRGYDRHVGICWGSDPLRQPGNSDDDGMPF